MTVGQKASVSLLIAVLLFAGFAVAAFSGLFDFVQTQFRNPTLTRGIESSLAKAAQAEGKYHASALERFGAALAQDPVRRSFLPNMSAQDAFDRANLLGKLQEETAGLAGIRLIDSNGKRIHFSTFVGDVLNRSETQVAYRNYGDLGDDPYDSIAAGEGSRGAVRIDPSSGRFVYSLPFADSFGVYRGTAVLEVSIDGFVSSLVKEGLAPVGETALAAGDRGVLLKAPAGLREILAGRVAELWASGLDEGPVAIAASNTSGESYVLFSKAADLGGIVGYVVPESVFALPRSMKAILLGSFFLTAFLLAFLLLNIRQDRMAVLSDRIKRFQISLLQEYVDNKADIDFDRWRRELEGRRTEVRDAIRKSVGSLRSGKRADVDELIDKSWDEILAVLGGKIESRREGIGLQQIERLLGEALKSGGLDLPAVLARAEQAPQERVTPPRSIEPYRSVNLVTESGSTGAEEPEELESLEAEDEGAPPARKAPEAPKAAAPEEFEELEEVEEAESVEEVDELEEVEAVEEAEPSSPAQAELPSVEEVVEPADLERARPADIRPVALRYAIPQGPPAESVAEIPSEPEELEDLEELEEPEELEALPAAEPAAGGELGADEGMGAGMASERAYELALVQDEDIPLIPESSGLELVDGTDVSEIIGFIDVEEGDRNEDLDLLDMDAASGNPEVAPTRVADSDESPEFILDGADRSSSPSYETAEEMEFELLLSSIDLSSLEKWGDGQSAEGGEGANGSAALGGQGAEEEPEFLLEPRFLLSETQSDAGEAGDDAIVNGEIPMLSSQMRDLLEILPIVELDEGPPVEVESYLGPWSRYRPFGSADASPAVGELPVVGEGEPWTEAEYLSPLELSRYVDLPPASEDEAEGEEAEGGEGAIIFRDGIYTLNPEMPGDPGAEDVDPALRGLVDAVLGGPESGGGA